MGFNTFGAGYGRGIDAVQRAGLVLEDQSPRMALAGSPALVLDGRIVPASEWPTHPRNTFPEQYRATMPWALAPTLVTKHNPLENWSDWTNPANAPLDIAMREFLSGQGLDDEAIALAFDTAPYHGDSARDVSALMYEFSDGWTKQQMTAGMTSYAVKGGNMHLPQAMAKLLKGDVLTGPKVTGVASDDTGASVTCADGDTFHADRVVMALPFSTMRDVAFEPGLAGLQAQAVNELPYQAISIMFVRVETPYWEEDGIDPSMWTDGLSSTISAQRFGGTPEEVTGLMVQSRGTLARKWAATAVEELQRRVVAEIEAIRPAAKGKLRATYVQNWSTDPFNKGDWAYWKPGQITTFAQAMAKPAGRIHFAGEHTATQNRGLEAAMESSERVALEILSAEGA